MSKLFFPAVFTLFLLITSVFTNDLRAQLIMRGLEVGPWAGTAMYLGDLNTNWRLTNLNLAGGFAARYNFNNRISARLSINYGHVEAYDSESNNPFERIRNLSFQTDIFDGTGQVEFNFLPYIHGSKDYFFTPYVFAGISVFNYAPKTVADDGNLVSLRELGTEGQLRGEEYLPISTALAYGIGFKVDLTYEWSIDIFLSARNTNTDYIDDVSTIYPDRSDLARSRDGVIPYASQLYDRSLTENGLEQRDREGEQRGDSTNKDNLFFLGIGINYYFGDVRCPKIGGR